MEQVLHGLHWKTLLRYLDEVIVIFPDFDSHLQRLKKVFSRLQNAGLKPKPTKCKLLQDEVHYLGHVVSSSRSGYRPRKGRGNKETEASQGCERAAGIS